MTKPSKPGVGRTLARTRYPGIYRRGGSYVVIWRHKGRQRKQFFRTLAEAREAKGRRDSGDRKPPSRKTFETYAREWIETYRGRTRGGLSEETRADYRSSLERDLIPFFRSCKLSDIEPRDIRQLL